MTASFWECQNAKKNYFHLAGLATSGQVAKHVRTDAPAVNHAVSFSSMPPTQEPSRPHNSQFAVICLLLSLFLVFYQRFDTFLIKRTVAHKFVSASLMQSGRYSNKNRLCNKSNFYDHAVVVSQCRQLDSPLFRI